MPTPRQQQVSLTDTPYYHCLFFVRKLDVFVALFYVVKTLLQVKVTNTDEVGLKRDCSFYPLSFLLLSARMQS